MRAFNLVFTVILLLSAVSVSGGRRRRRSRRFNFNCRSQCGQYEEGDRLGEALNQECSAMDQRSHTVQKSQRRKSKVRKTKSTRIVGGHASTKAMPWMVLINVRRSICGGTLINSHFVLTAAHCFCSPG